MIEPRTKSIYDIMLMLDTNLSKIKHVGELVVNRLTQNDKEEYINIWNQAMIEEIFDKYDLILLADYILCHCNEVDSEMFIRGFHKSIIENITDIYNSSTEQRKDSLEMILDKWVKRDFISNEEISFQALKFDVPLSNFQFSNFVNYSKISQLGTDKVKAYHDGFHIFNSIKNEIIDKESLEAMINKQKDAFKINISMINEIDELISLLSNN